MGQGEAYQRKNFGMTKVSFEEGIVRNELRKESRGQSSKDSAGHLSTLGFILNGKVMEGASSRTGQ
jgi:hypothetical protein